MNWNSIDIKPKKEYGWFAVAVLPRNHSGLDEKNKSDFIGLCDLKGDNDWRKSFGFEKAWLNNGEWYAPDHHGSSNNITKLVTHWGELPSVPILESVHKHPQNWRFNERKTQDVLIKIATERMNESKSEDNFISGFVSAMKMFGIY